MIEGLILLMYRFTTVITAFVATATCLGLVGFSGATPTQAATMIYTDQSAFEAALTSSYLETFSDGAGDFENFYDFAGSGFGYRVTASTDAVYKSGSFIGSFFPTAGLIFTATAGNYSAIGGNFYLTNENNDFRSGQVILTTNDGTSTSFSPTSPTAGSFRGFISTAPISVLTVGTSSTNTYNAVDNLRVGIVAPTNPSAAPEPGSFAFLLPVMGIVGAGGIIRRRRKK
jgi:hypothetical protein